MTEWLQFHFSLSCIGEGNGNPLQCSCLENPRDGGAWWLSSMESHRVGHDWSDLAAAAASLSVAVHIVGHSFVSFLQIFAALSRKGSYFPNLRLGPYWGQIWPGELVLTNKTWALTCKSARQKYQESARDSLSSFSLFMKPTLFQIKLTLALPWWLSSKESACQCRRHGFDPWSRKIPHAVEQLRPCATTIEPGNRDNWAHVLQPLKPMCCLACALQQVKTPQ